MSTTVIHPSTAPARRACATDAAKFSTDRGVLTDWIRALRACAGCPFAAQCETERDALPTPPAGTIYAGVFYTPRGEALTTHDEVLRYGIVSMAPQSKRHTKRNTSAGRTAHAA